MSDVSTPEAAHRDNMLGICHTLANDLGIDALWLRLALGAMLLVNLKLPFIVYGVLGLIVIATRLLVPARRAQASAEIVQLEPAARAAAPANDRLEHARAA